MKITQLNNMFYAKSYIYTFMYIET